MFVVRKVWRALFSWKTCFENRTFALLPTKYKKSVGFCNFYISHLSLLEGKACVKFEGHHGPAQKPVFSLCNDLNMLYLQVADMQVELEELQPRLVVASEENDKMMKVC